MKINKAMKTILPLAAFAGLAVTANAAFILPIYVTGPHYHTPGNYEASNLLIAPHPLLSEESATATYASHGDNSSTGWLNDAAVASLVFELDQAYDLTNAYVWNINQTGAQSTRAVGTMSIDVSLDGSAWTQAVGGTRTLQTVPTGTDLSIPVDDLALAVSNVKFVRFNTLTSQGGAFIGLGAVRFEGTAVPEPTTTALLGLGGLALILRRRK